MMEHKFERRALDAFMEHLREHNTFYDLLTLLRTSHWIIRDCAEFGLTKDEWRQCVADAMWEKHAETNREVKRLMGVVSLFAAYEGWVSAHSHDKGTGTHPAELASLAEELSGTLTTVELACLLIDGKLPDGRAVPDDIGSWLWLSDTDKSRVLLLALMLAKQSD